MRKYRPPLSETEVKELARLSLLDFSNFNETDVREEYIRPVLTLLGYRKNQDYAVSTEESFSLHNAFLRVGRDRIKLDYITDIRKQYFWLIEAKDGNPQYRNTISDDDVGQAYFYSLHPSVNCRYFAVSNGWLFNLYDRDLLDDKFSPILSIRHQDMPSRFLELDSYIGSTQLVSNTKVKLLSQIEKTLSAEVSLERLEEFAGEVGKLIHKVRPQVLENFRENAKKVEIDSSKQFDDLLASLRPYEIVDSLFMSMMSVGDINKLSYALTEKVKSSFGQSNHFLLIDRILLKELRPVRYWYYINAIYFLVALDRSGVEYLDYPTNGEPRTKVRDIVHQYLWLIFTRFQDRKEIRLLTLFEGLLLRSFKRFLILTPQAREGVANHVQFEKFFLPEELVAWHGPNPAAILIDIVNNGVLRACGNVIDLFYDRQKRQFKLELGKQEFSKFCTYSSAIEESTEDAYRRIKSELGSSWSELTFMDSAFLHWDPIIAATFEILLSQDDLVKSLPEKTIAQIAHVVSIGVGGGYGDDFSEKFNIQKSIYSVEQREVFVKEFFGIDYWVE